MKTTTTTRRNAAQAARRAASLFSLLVSLLALAALCTPAGAGAATTRHGMGAVLPTTQVNAHPRTKTLLATLPASIDLRSAADLSSPVGDQGSVGSCVTWAIDYAMLGWYSRHTGKPGQPFNPMYTYSQIHLSNTADGGGSRAESALAVAQSQGNDTMAHYSHGTSDFWTLPSASERANAAGFRIAGWQTLFANVSGFGSGTTSATLIETALASGKPVAIAMQVRPGFESEMNLEPRFGIAGSDDGDVTGAILGAHEVLAIGYDQYGVWFQNSWGATYGDNGYGRLSWDVVGHDVYQAHTITGFASVSGDTTPPAMGAVSQQYATGQRITGTTEPVSFTWSASDAGGIGSYAVYLKTDGGSWVQETSLASTATHVTYALSIGHSYQLAVSATDAAGNRSAYSYSATVTPRVLDDKAFTAATGWARYTLADTFGGTYNAAKQAGSWRQVAFTGRDVALIAPKFNTAGVATIYCDGVRTGAVDLYSASIVTRQAVAQCHFAQSGQHLMKVSVAGTAGRPWVGIDAFAYLG